MPAIHSSCISRYETFLPFACHKWPTHYHILLHLTKGGIDSLLLRVHAELSPADTPSIRLVFKELGEGKKDKYT